ncbi:MAG TPA: mechanosensitive ion channel family protein [Candidatus Rubrimentiphilum sp.]|nr:mechanosensitive ion channel family protein [Candidatus Rubrimentiphilum sp.]
MNVNSAAWLPLVWLLGGIIVGLIVQFGLLLPLRRIAKRQGWESVAAIAEIVGSVTVLWCALAGVYVGLGNVALTPRTGLFVDRIISALAILSVTWVLARFLATAVTAYGRQADKRMFSASLYANVVQGAVLVVGIVTVLSTFGVAIAPLLTTLGLGGLAVALALRDTLANLFSGVHIVASRQIRPGDFVKFDFGVEGEVTDIQWRSTTLLDAQKNPVVIPNEKVAGSVLINYSLGSPEQIMAVTVTVPWKGNYHELEALASRASRGAPITLTGVNEASLEVTAYLPVESVQTRASAAAEFRRRIYDAVRTANMGDRTTTAS